MTTMTEELDGHVASLADDGGLGDAIEDRLAAESDDGVLSTDEEGFTAPSETGESAALPDDEASEPTLGSLQDQIGDIQKESDGRLTALVDNREKLRQANEGIESMRQLMQAWEEKANAPTPEDQAAKLAAEYGPEVIADPNNRYVTDQIRSFEERQERLRQAEEGRKRQVAQQVQGQSQERAARQQAYNLTSAQEQEFMKEKADYPDAYKHFRESREKVYSGIYQPEQVQALLDREEEVIVAESIKQGRNIAQHVYQMATDMGYIPAEANEAADDVGEEAAMFKERQERVKQFRQDNEFPDVARLQAAKADSKLGDGTYNRGGNARTMKGEQVFDQLPKAQRMKLFADPDKFKQFVLTGELEI